MVEEGKAVVTITGIYGYIGSHVTLKFLQSGKYRVRITVRNKNIAAKLEPLQNTFGEELYNQLEIVEADLQNEKSLRRAFHGSSFVVHAASPFFATDDAEKLITTAINGTNVVMRACKAAGVRRCVVTSNIESVSLLTAAQKPADFTYNESHWSNPDRPEGMSNQFKSKVLSEFSVWDFQAAQPEDKRFEIVTICPGFVLGPPLRKEDFTSGSWMKSLMQGSLEQITSEHMPIVDVRDVAQAHLLAITNAAAANRRFILCESSRSGLEIVAPIAAKYHPLGWPITENLQDVDPSEEISRYNNRASLELGVTYHDFSETMIDMADAMVALGTVLKQ